MLTEILLSATLMGGGPANANPGQETLQAVRELYTYATQSVQVEASEVRRMIEDIRTRLADTPEASSEALQSLVAAAERPEPDGRDIRVHARELYASLASDQA
jgi:hypothetical protein